MRTKQTMVQQVTPAPPETENERFVYDQLIEARQKNKAISRHAIAQSLQVEKNLPPKVAFAVVEEFCADKSPSTPEYLGSEFLVPYQKALALMLSVAGLLGTGFGISLFNNKQQNWPWVLGLGLLFVGLSVYVWVQSLYRETREIEEE